MPVLWPRLWAYPLSISTGTCTTPASFLLSVCVCVCVCVRYSGILSAYGLALADVVHEAQEPCAVHYEGLHVFYNIMSVCVCVDSTFQYLDERLDVLSRECVDELEKQGFKRSSQLDYPPVLKLHVCVFQG